MKTILYCPSPFLNQEPVLQFGSKKKQRVQIPDFKTISGKNEKLSIHCKKGFKWKIKSEKKLLRKNYTKWILYLYHKKNVTAILRTIAKIKRTKKKYQRVLVTKVKMYLLLRNSFFSAFWLFALPIFGL